MLKRFLRNWLSVPTDVYHRPLRIAVLGDSLSCQNYLMSRCWPAVLEENLRQSAADAQVFNCSFGGHNFYRANRAPVFGGRTAIEHLLRLKPDIVILALGYNDAISKNDGRSMEQLKTDVLETLASLRGLKVLYISEIPPADKAGLIDWIDLDAFIRARVQTNEFSNFNLGQIYEMGGALPDGLHLNAGGAVLQAAHVTKALAATGWIPEWPTTGTPERNDPDAIYKAFKNPTDLNRLHVDSVLAALYLKAQ